MSRVALVSGAGQGLGLEFCRLLVEQGDTVVACPRRSGSAGLETLRARWPELLYEIPMDVGDPRSIDAAVKEVSGRVERIDLLLNNAGIYPDKGVGVEELDPQRLARAFEVNAVGPLRVIRALLPLLRRGRDKRLIQITSLMGSIEDNAQGGSYAYRMSKCALNMATRNLAHDLDPEGFITLSIHPGWVRTRMGSGAAPLDIPAAAAEVLRVALQADRSDSGTFKGPGGKDLPY